MTRSLSVLALVFGCLAACNAKRPPVPCEPGDIEVCDCPGDMSDIVRVCDTDGRFGDCACPEPEVEVNGELPGGFTAPVETLTSGQIELQLWWVRADGSSRPQQSDVDLHVRHPDGCWGNGLWDCYYANRTPDWRGDGGDACELAQDLFGGPGPEVTTLYEPVMPLDYRVAVDVFSGDGDPPLVPLLQVYVEGALRQEFVGPTMRDGDWWEVGTLSGATGVLQEDPWFGRGEPPCEVP